ncbi:MAG: SDR family oxidoreductase [Opitutaceae bacterium]|nr:SDR family oxidoreductase [Opitutaceae bacterium]
MFKLDNKQALITGAGSGIGAAIAHAFAEAGATVWVTDRDEIGGNKTVEEIRKKGHQAHFLLLDVTDEATCIQSLNSVREEGPINILVNNAGIGHVGDLETTTGDNMDRLYQVNVKGVFNMMKAAIPFMLEQKTGNIVNMASIGGIVGVKNRLAYCMTKFAVVGLTKSTALDYAKRGIRVNCICPGRVETPFVKARLAEYDDPEKGYREMSSTQPIGRMAQPAEIAAAALYLASDEAGSVTGSCLSVDGGWSAG